MRHVERLTARQEAGERVRLYLSGPMSGRPDWGVAAFGHAAGLWRARGFDVFNPAESYGGAMDLPRATYMRRDIEELLRCDVLLLLPGWVGSRGARLEREVAIEIGLEVIEHE